MDSVAWQGVALAIVGLILGTLGDVLVEDRSNTDSTRLVGRALRFLGLGLLIGGVMVAALAYVFPASSAGPGI